MGDALRVLGVLRTLRTLSFPLSPTTLVDFPWLPLHLLCPSPLLHHVHSQSATKLPKPSAGSQSYHKLSPRNFHKLKVGAVFLGVEGSQRGLYCVHHPAVVERGQQGAVWTHLVHVLGRVCAQSEEINLARGCNSLRHLPPLCLFERAKTCSKWLQEDPLLLTKPSGGSCHAGIVAEAPLTKGRFSPPMRTAP